MSHRYPPHITLTISGSTLFSLILIHNRIWFLCVCVTISQPLAYDSAAPQNWRSNPNICEWLRDCDPCPKQSYSIIHKFFWSDVSRKNPVSSPIILSLSHVRNSFNHIRTQHPLRIQKEFWLAIWNYQSDRQTVVRWQIVQFLDTSRCPFWLHSAYNKFSN